MKFLYKLLPLLFFVLCLGACDSLLRVSGKVVDEEGKPVSKASVFVIYGNWVSKSTTREDGTFSNGQVHGGTENLQLLVSKEGKQLYLETLDYHKSPVSKTIVLKKGTQSELQTPDHHS